MKSNHPALTWGASSVIVIDEMSRVRDRDEASRVGGGGRVIVEIHPPTQ